MAAKYRAERITVCRYDRPVVGEGERAVSRIGVFARWQGHAEVAAPFNGHIQRIAGLFQSALLVNAVNACGTHAQTNLRAGWHKVTRIRAHGPRAAQILIDKILELRPTPLVASGRHVGDVVGNCLDVRRLGLHARTGDIKGTHHRMTSLRVCLAPRSPQQQHDDGSMGGNLHGHTHSH